jgi:hypothetical protein
MFFSTWPGLKKKAKIAAATPFNNLFSRFLSSFGDFCNLKKKRLLFEIFFASFIRAILPVDKKFNLAYHWITISELGTLVPVKHYWHLKIN